MKKNHGHKRRKTSPKQENSRHHNELRISENDETNMKGQDGIYRQGKWDYGFIDVQTEDGNRQSYYVFGRNTKGALPGDTVNFRLKMFKGKPEASVLKITKRGEQTLSGVYHCNKTFGFVELDNPQFKQDVFIPGKKSLDAKDGDKVGIKITNFEGKKPEGEILKIFWPAGEAKVDILGIAFEMGAKMDFPEELLNHLNGISVDIPKSEVDKRVDHRDLFTFTIDGADAKDLDDAISIEKDDKGNYKLYVHIADVTHYVKENDITDTEALSRATSIYLVDKVIPMIPEKLSNGLCSLNADTDKLTLTCEMLVNKAGHVMESKVYESVIHSNFRLTYKDIEEYKSGNIQVGDALHFEKIVSQELADHIDRSKELKEILDAHKTHLWALEFDFPEPYIVTNELWDPVEYKTYPKYESNKIIEHFMVLANECVSKEFSKVPFLYRIHPKPEGEDLEQMQKILKKFDADFSSGGRNMSQIISDILKKIKGSSKERFLSKVVLRSLTKAVYSPENQGHFGLALEWYSHFTSPIRRYPDLQIHRIIKEKLHKRLHGERIEHYQNILHNVALQSTDKEKLAQDIEYKVHDFMGMRYMKNRLGQEFEGFISGAIPKGFFVELDNTIEGFVGLDNLWDVIDPKDVSDYKFDEEMMEYYNTRNGHKFGVGERVKIRVMDVDEDYFKIDFELVEMGK